MCTNIRKVYNKYTGQEIFSKCGHCPACLQEKAAYRVSRIHAQDSKDNVCLMVSLTYRRNDVPYIRREDAYNFAGGKLRKVVDGVEYYSSLPVYRDCSYRKVRQSAAYDIGYKRTIVTERLDQISFDDKVNFKGLKDLKHKHGCIGVTYYPDLQHFLARLRINLKRNFNYEGEFKSYNCSEYGSKSLRPHFHLLLWIPKGSTEIFRSAIFESWPYGDISRWEFDKYLQKFIQPCVQEARSASSYVASYVNCGSDFPKFLEHYFRPKHSYSKGFGTNYPLFQLSSILSKFRNGHLTFYKQNIETGKIFELPFPKYVIHRYFPKFKGYGLLSSYALPSCMSRIRNLCQQSDDEWRLNNPTLYEFGDFSYIKGDYSDGYKSPSYYDSRKGNFFNGYNDIYAGFDDYMCPSPVTDIDFIRFYFNKASIERGVPIQEFSDADLFKTSVRLDNAYRRFLECSGEIIPFEEYAKLHVAVWRLYSSDVLRLSMTNEDIPLNERYFNLDDVKYRVENLGSPMPLGFTHEMFSVTDPNKFVSTMQSTSKWSDDFYENVKHRRINNLVYSSRCEEM